MGFSLFNSGVKTPSPVSSIGISPAPTTPPSPIPTPSPSSKTTASSNSVQDIVAPSAIEVDFSHIKIDDVYVRTLFVTGYPRYVSANWLSPLINFNHSLDIAMYVFSERFKGYS